MHHPIVEPLSSNSTVYFMEGAQVKKMSSGTAESLLILDQYGIIQWASPSIYYLLGYSSDEISGREIFDLVDTDSTRRITRMYFQIQQGSNRVNEGLMRLLKKNGESTALFLIFNSVPCFREMNAMLVYLQKFNYDKKQDDIHLLNDEAELEIELRTKIEQEIAAELHDHINPTLAAVRMIVDYSIRTGDHHSSEFKKVPEILGSLIQNIRNVCHTITRKATRDFELGEALKSLIGGFKVNSEIRFVLKYDRSLETLLTTNQKVHLVRIIQEQLMNIVKHAAASKVLISFQSRNNKIIVATKDNGKGFNPNKSENGIGLSNMYYRAHLLDGDMHVNSRHGEGTTIIIEFPLN